MGFERTMASGYDVDVIILSMNRIAETLDAIDSARAQQGLAVAVHIVDQASTPENLAQLRAHIEGKPDIVLTVLDRNVGVPAGRNIASRSGRAPIIVAIDNDAVFATPDTLRQAVDLLNGEPGLGAIAFRILDFETGRDDLTSWNYPMVHWPRRHLEFPAAAFVGAGHAMRRKAFEEVGGYDEQLFFIGEERELSSKLLNIGFEIRYVGRIVVRHKLAAEARVSWANGRHFYTARNRIYLALKSGDPACRLVQSIAALLIKAIRTGRLVETLRAILAAFALYRRIPAALRRSSRLTPETAELIDALNERHRSGIWARVRNAWSAGAVTDRASR